MKKEQDYIRDIAEIRSMMERSSKFLSLSGWAGILAGIYALTGVYIAVTFFNFNPDQIALEAGSYTQGLEQVIILAMTILVLALGTAIFLSSVKARKRGEKIWNTTSRRLLTHMAVPLMAGGVLILILLSKGQIGLLAPLSLIFYGISLYNAGKFTYDEVKALGILQVILGLVSSFYIEYGMWIWATGFGILHIIYGIYIHFKYER